MVLLLQPEPKEELHRVAKGLSGRFQVASFPDLRGRRCGAVPAGLNDSARCRPGRWLRTFQNDS